MQVPSRVEKASASVWVNNTALRDPLGNDDRTEAVVPGGHQKLDMSRMGLKLYLVDSVAVFRFAFPGLFFLFYFSLPSLVIPFLFCVSVSGEHRRTIATGNGRAQIQHITYVRL